MLSIILGIFGSGGFGSIVGLVGGYLNRKLDIEGKKIDLEDHKAQREHDLLRQEADRKYMESEYAQKIQVAGIETEGKIEVAGYSAMENSYGFAAPTPADGWVDKVSKLVRPFITLALLLGTTIIFWQVQQLVDKSAMATQAEVIALYKEVIEWIIFQAGVTIGWWFAMRTGKSPTITRN